LKKIILEYELSSIGTHTLVGRAISTFLKMGTKCFRNNAKIQPMRRNLFLQLGTLETHWELYWEPLFGCNFGPVNRIFLRILLSNASCGGAFKFWGRLESTPWNEFRGPSWAYYGCEKKLTQIRTNFFWWFLFFSSHAPPIVRVTTYFFN
jgi:hypothetical protein